jgi:hypothetical protein
MTSELHRIRNNLMSKELQQETYVPIIPPPTITMMKFLPENIKFLMPSPPRNFTLKTLTPKIPQKPTTIVPGIPCKELEKKLLKLREIKYFAWYDDYLKILPDRI